MELIGPLAILAAIYAVAYFLDKRLQKREVTKVEVEEFSDREWPARKVGPESRTRLP